MDAESEGLEGVIEGMRTILQYLQAKSFIRTLKINSQARHPPPPVTAGVVWGSSRDVCPVPPLISALPCSSLPACLPVCVMIYARSLGL